MLLDGSKLDVPKFHIISIRSQSMINIFRSRALLFPELS